VKKTRQNNKLKPGSDSIRTVQALVKVRLGFARHRPELTNHPLLSFEESPMRALLFCLVGLAIATSSGLARADMKLSPKAAPGAIETRYFTSIDGLMNGNADIILKETRQGKTVTAAVSTSAIPRRRARTARTASWSILR
jgi:hypothetical protein